MLSHLATLSSVLGEKKAVSWIEAEHIRHTRFLPPCSRAMSQVALSPLTCLQRQQLPLILDQVTAVDGVHLQLHIPVHIPKRQNKTCQHKRNNNNHRDLYVYHQQLQSNSYKFCLQLKPVLRKISVVEEHVQTLTWETVTVQRREDEWQTITATEVLQQQPFP